MLMSIKSEEKGKSVLIISLTVNSFTHPIYLEVKLIKKKPRFKNKSHEVGQLSQEIATN